MNQDDEYSYNTADKFNLTAGNAGNIVVLIDGKVKGKAGKIRTSNWIFNYYHSNFNN